MQSKPYDMVFKLKSLSKIKEGFEILYSEKGKQKYEEFKAKYSTIITAIGNSNQGKSFILSKITDIKIPNGHSINTKGLSIYFIDNFSKNNSNQNLIIIDTEGYQKVRTISNEERIKINKLNKIEKEEKINNFLLDKQITEDFIQNFSLYYSDFVIVVIGQLNLQEENLLTKIKENLNRQNLFIIHNLSLLEKKEEVQNYMKDIIEESFILNVRKMKMVHLNNKEEENVNSDYYIETIDEKQNLYLIHLIMAKEGSEAGNYYNQSCIKFLKNNILSFNQKMKFDLINKLSLFLCDSIYNYFETPQFDVKKNKNFKLITKDNIKIENNIFKIDVPYDLILNKLFYLNNKNGIQNGLIKTSFNYFKKNNEKEYDEDEEVENIKNKKKKRKKKKKKRKKKNRRKKKKKKERKKKRREEEKKKKKERELKKKKRKEKEVKEKKKK